MVGAFVLRYLNLQPMNNASLRERFGLETKQSATASRIIKQALAADRIKAETSGGSRVTGYLPWWA
ncbi:MAG: hypothetical protein MJK04_13035 [Psychrosphaera sp.]|nr:hypothetical protein [Psychrosphaera sp.]